MCLRCIVCSTTRGGRYKGSFRASRVRASAPSIVAAIARAVGDGIVDASGCKAREAPETGRSSSGDVAGLIGSGPARDVKFKDPSL